MTHPRTVLLSLAAVLLLVGGLFGLASVTAGPNTFEPMQCGSLFRPSDEAAAYEDSVNMYAFGDDANESVTACEQDRGKRQVPAYGALGLGILGVFGGLMMSSRSRGA